VVVWTETALAAGFDPPFVTLQCGFVDGGVIGQLVFCVVVVAVGFVRAGLGRVQVWTGEGDVVQFTAGVEQLTTEVTRVMRHPTQFLFTLFSGWTVLCIDLHHYRIIVGFFLGQLLTCEFLEGLGLRPRRPLTVTREYHLGQLVLVLLRDVALTR